MKCSRCQHENASEARFCSACGVSLNLTCPSCGHSNAPSSLFCNQCGHTLSASDAAGRAQRFVSPESYTPKHLAEKILTSKAALEGTREQAREHLTTATAMYREMDMRFWLEKTGTELKALD